MTDTLLPNEALQSQVSAFVDDELPAAETDLFVRRLVKDVDLKQAMSRYQLIGEALRTPAARASLSRDFSARVANLLEQQDAAPAKASVAPRSNSSWLKPVGGIAIAASVALVSVLAIRSPLTGSTPANLTAETLQPVELTAQQTLANASNSYVVPAPASSPTAPIPATRLTNYVLAHSEFSSPLGRRNVMTGLLAGEQTAADPPVEVEQATGH
jgi:sigma-E factor negative regulatory protein RseA